MNSSVAKIVACACLELHDFHEDLSPFGGLPDSDLYVTDSFKTRNSCFLSFVLKQNKPSIDGRN